MKKTIVIYKTISGFTKKYAEMIGEELGAKVISLNKVNKEILADYEVIIYGGSLHAVGVVGFKTLKGMIKNMPDKKLVLFAVGASPQKEGIIEEIKKHNCVDYQPNKVFYLRGGFDFSKLNLVNKIVMFFFINLLKLKSKKSADAKGMIAAYKNPVDFTSRENISDLVNYVKSL